jgi:AcrR family transcriptional regulator
VGSVIDKASGRAWHEGVRVTKVPESGAKRKLLDAAVSLVARAGFDSVSVRDVTGASGTNVAAVNYHYGSREGLMEALITQILEPVCAERIALLEATGKHASVEEVVAAFVNALTPAATRIGMDAPLFFRLVGRVLSLPEEAMPKAMESARHEVRRRFLAQLGKALPEKPAKDLAVDWAFFEAGIAQSLVFEATSKNITVLMDRWIDFGLRAFGPGLAAIKGDAQGLLFEL